MQTLYPKTAEKILSDAGKKALGKLSPERRKEIASKAGKIGAQTEKVKATRFTTERWNALTPEQQRIQVTRAAKALQDSLKDEDKKQKHYERIFKQLQIGYMSRAHNELHQILEQYGFESHVVIGNCQVDECHKELKLVVEYNGDYWHCNPRKWKEHDYNKTIKMKASQKWEIDKKRNFYLRNKGYIVIIIWESGWIEDKQKYIDGILEIYNEARIKKEN